LTEVAILIKRYDTLSVSRVLTAMPCRVLLNCNIIVYSLIFCNSSKYQVRFSSLLLYKRCHVHFDSDFYGRNRNSKCDVTDNVHAYFVNQACIFSKFHLSLVAFRMGSYLIIPFCFTAFVQNWQKRNSNFA